MRNRIIRKQSRVAAAAVIAAAIIGSALTVGPAAQAATGSASAPENLGGVTGTGFASPTGKNLTGDGQIIVDIDGAFNPTHPMLAGRVIEEACFGEAAPSDPNWASTCSSSAKPWSRDAGILFESGPNTSRYNTSCIAPQSDLVCGAFHGTATAALAAGARVSPSGVGTISGVAPNAKVVLLKVGRPAENASSAKAIYAALTYVKEVLAPKYGSAIAAVNLSYAGGGVVNDSDPAPVTPISGYATDLKRLGIALVISAGNQSLTAATEWWSSAPDAVIVGATNVTDPNTLTKGANGTNASKRVDLLVPVGTPDSVSDPNGVWTAWSYRTATSGSAYENNYNKCDGTSFASPQVAGAFAVLRERFPSASVDELTALMRRTGVNVADTRPGNASIVTPRLQLGVAAGSRTTPVWDYTGDGRTDEPILAADKHTLMLFTVKADGNLDANNPVTVDTNWTGHAATAPVHDYRLPNTNGFIATTVTGGRTDLVYYGYDRATRKLGAGTTVLTNAGSDIVGISYVTGLPTVGTGTGIVIQRSSGALELRTRIDGSDQLGAPLALLPAGAAVNSKLVSIADIDRDGRPDLIVRDSASGLPRAYVGTGDPNAPFAASPVALTSAWYWVDKMQAAVVDEWTSKAPYATYVAPATGNQLTFPLRANGTIDDDGDATAIQWVSGVRVLFAARAD